MQWHHLWDNFILTNAPKLNIMFKSALSRLKLNTETYRSGHNGADSKHSRVCHDPISVNPLFIGVCAMCNCTFENLHLAVFSQFRFWLCLYNFIWRRIEVVITGLTRNQLGSNPPRVRISPSPPRTTVIFGLRLFSFVMD